MTSQELEEIEGVLYEDKHIYRTKLSTFVLSDPSDKAEFVKRRGLLIKANEANLTINFSRQQIVKPSPQVFMVGAVDSLKVGNIIEVDLSPRRGSFRCETDKGIIAGIHGNIIVLEKPLKRKPRNGGDVVKWTQEVIGYERSYVDEVTFDIWERSLSKHGKS